MGTSLLSKKSPALIELKKLDGPYNELISFAVVDDPKSFNKIVSEMIHNINAKFESEKFVIHSMHIAFSGGFYGSTVEGSADKSAITFTTDVEQFHSHSQMAKDNPDFSKFINESMKEIKQLEDDKYTSAFTGMALDIFIAPEKSINSTSIKGPKYNIHFEVLCPINYILVEQI
jgi:hypothetical protein